MRHSPIMRTAAFATATVAAVMAIAACSHSSSNASKAAAGGTDQVRASSPSAAGRTLARDSVGAPAMSLSTAKIRTAQMTVVIRHGQSVAARADAAEAIVLRHDGEVDADDRSAGKDPSATLVLRVPPRDLRVVLDELAHLGRERSRHLSTQDVTAKVADVTSRVTSGTRAISRLRELYAHTVKVADVIRIEDELSARESDLESLQARQRALAAETSTAAVTLSLLSGAAPVEKPPATHHRTGFIGGLRNGWDAFTTAAGALATALGAVLPFAVLILALAVVARLLWPRLRTQPVSTPTPTPEQ